jgi:hypothetical protein
MLQSSCGHLPLRVGDDFLEGEENIRIRLVQVGRDAYDASLEAFSRPLMSLVEYSLDEEGHMTVENDKARWYRYIDLTSQTEALFRFIERTIDAELVEELAFLAHYDRTKKAIQDIVDMPDHQIDLFIRVCLQNNGRLSSPKRTSRFSSLSDEEVARMELAVQRGYAGDGEIHE